MNEQELKERIEYIKNSPCASFWIKKAYQQLSERDILDALRDVEMLADVLTAQWIEISGGVKK